MVQIYGLLHPVTRELRYIGKANDATERLKTHIRDARRRRSPVLDWIRGLIAQGLQPEVMVIQTCEREEWPDLERGYIATARHIGYNLLNLANGGDEPYCPPEVRAENGRKNAAARVANPERKRCWRIQIAVDSLKRGGYLTNEARERFRAIGRQYPHLFGTWINL